MTASGTSPGFGTTPGSDASPGSGTTPGPGTSPAPKARSARRLFASSVLSTEVVVVLLTGLVADRLQLAPSAQVWLVSGIVVALLVGAVATLRNGVGYGIGSVVQLVLIASGFVVSVMWFLGAVFGILWVLALVLGRRIDRERAERDRADYRGI